MTGPFGVSGMMVASILAPLLLSSSCGPPNPGPVAPADGQGAAATAVPAPPGPSETGADAGVSTADADGASDPSSTAVGSLGSEEFDVQAWLAAHGVPRWLPDPACWRAPEGQTLRAGSATNECLCRGPMVVADRELLHCQSPHRQPEGAAVPYVTHTVLYAVERGRLRVMLDLPTSAAMEGCKADLSDVCWVALRVAPETGALRIADGPSGRCDETLATLDDLIRYGESWRAAWRTVARRICSSRGRYGWGPTGLTAEPDMLGVRRF